MIVSYKWLNTFFDGTLPEAEKVSDALTFHAWEIEGMKEVGDDVAIEVNVLPDTSMWALSHRGVAKNLSVILGVPLARDPLSNTPILAPKSDIINIEIKSEKCLRYVAVRMDGVKVGPSPSWLKDAIESIGQKSINNIVDAANYVMFDVGQPLHAFDAAKLSGVEKDHIVVREALHGEKIIALTGEEYELSNEDLLIVDGGTNKGVGIAGIKGGKVAEVDANTTNLLIEAANFDQLSVRKTSQRLKLRTDASARYENGVVPELVGHGITEVVKLILEVAGGKLVGYKDVFPKPRDIKQVSLSLSKTNSVLGLALKMSDVVIILDRFGYEYEVSGEEIKVTPPFERTDLTIEEDLIEEIGRVYGYEHVPSVVPSPLPLTEINNRFYYGETARNTLIELGFSEIFTSSFRESDEVKLANALASDKGYVRSTLKENMSEALERNRMNADLLGLSQVCLFEIGTVFKKNNEYTALTLGVRNPGGYRAKLDDPILEGAIDALERELSGITPLFKKKDGIAECNFDALLKILSKPSSYEVFTKDEDITYEPFSQYPFVSRDIALWTLDASKEEVESLLKANAGSLCTRSTLFDEFTKDGRTSYAFRLVFQSFEKTLTDVEVNKIMERINSAVVGMGWEVR